ncbi:MAG: hypothetical protein OXU20_41275 [Myxococcales bacterium]|nr:hypothetical protein [Myxococcales bacterium]
MESPGRKCRRDSGSSAPACVFALVLALVLVARPGDASACLCGLVSQVRSPLEGATVPAAGFFLSSNQPRDWVLTSPAGEILELSAERYGYENESAIVMCQSALYVVRPLRPLRPATGYTLTSGWDAQVRHFDVVTQVPVPAPSIQLTWRQNPVRPRTGTSCELVVYAHSYSLHVEAMNPGPDPVLLRVTSRTACGELNELNRARAVLLEPGHSSFDFLYYGRDFSRAFRPDAGPTREWLADLASGCMQLELTGIYGQPVATSWSCPPAGASEAERGDCPDYVPFDAGIVDGDGGVPQDGGGDGLADVGVRRAGPDAGRSKTGSSVGDPMHAPPVFADPFVGEREEPDAAMPSGQLRDRASGDRRAAGRVANHALPVRSTSGDGPSSPDRGCRAVRPGGLVGSTGLPTLVGGLLLLVLRARRAKRPSG